ncbi:MAG: lamin tail domain-containing protein [Candidatus Saccharimonadales bacterium]
MKYLATLWRVGTILTLLTLSLAPARAWAETFSVTAPPLLIREIKITGDEFVVLQATENIADLSEYWLGYSSSDTQNPGAIIPTQQLPARALATGQALLLTSDGATTCDAVLISKLSVSLSDTKGTLVVRKLQSMGLASTFTTVDSVNWIKPGATATTLDQIDLRKETAGMSYAVWYHDPSYGKPWRVGNLVDCSLTLAGVGTNPSQPSAPEVVSWAAQPVEPPAIIESVAEGTQPTEVITNPNANAGLAPPLITELLPNPGGTGTDATDEFVELYNSNDAVFDLSGFTIQTGLTTKHNYAFPQGTTLQPKSFRAFYASQTGLSMSNTSGQASLLDKNSAVIAQSDPYDAAPDGQAWVLANGVWYWTTKSTPQETNIVAQPIASAATAVKKLTVSAAAPSKAAVKGAATKTTSAAKATKTTKKAASTTKQTATTTRPTETAKSTSVHPGVLAAVAIGAVAYGLYEYRRDIANRLARFRRH